MVVKQRYEYSPLEEIFFPKKIENSQYDETMIDEPKKKNENINVVKNNLLSHTNSLDVCLKHKEKYLNTRNMETIQNFFFFYDYRKCINNIDGKIFIDQNPYDITNVNNSERDKRLGEIKDSKNYNTYMFAYNI